MSPIIICLHLDIHTMKNNKYKNLGTVRKSNKKS